MKKQVLALLVVLSLAVLIALSTVGKEGSNVDREDTQRFQELRHAMVETQIKARGVKNSRVLEAMEKVPRHQFVRPEDRHEAYRDSPLPIGHNQTISQPYIVALMTELLDPKKDHVVLEIGTGSGYQAAVLSELVKQVYTIEIVEPLGEKARERLKELGYDNIQVMIGDGYQGWPDHAPFDGVIVTAAPNHIPQPLVDQLKDGAKMVIPVGDYHQELQVVTKKGEKIEIKSVTPVRFVPMTGEAQSR
jgi:protein-L-isoaspartate(D-aspartate) O-methyltransferase